VSWRLPGILEPELYEWCRGIEPFNFGGDWVAHICPQLPFGGVFGAFNEPLGGPPQEPRRYAENDRKERNDGLGVFVNKLSRTSAPSFDHYQELGDTFLKGLAGFVVIMLAYAGLKRL
jgi:hypothetical protein